MRTIMKTGTGLDVIVDPHGISRKNDMDLPNAILERILLDITKDVPYGKGLDSVFYLTKDFGVNIGVSKCVKLRPEDKVIWAKLPGEKGEVPWVNRRLEQTSKGTVGLIRINDTTYLCLTSYFGDYHPSYTHRYTDPVEKQKAKEQWGVSIAMASGLEKED